MDVLTEMQEAQAPELRESHAEPAPYVDCTPDPQAAELALLRHLALEGELAMRRDQLQAEHQAVSQRLALARQQRQGLVQAVQAAGGTLPSWNL